MRNSRHQCRSSSHESQGDHACEAGQVAANATAECEQAKCACADGEEESDEDECEHDARHVVELITAERLSVRGSYSRQYPAKESDIPEERLWDVLGSSRKVGGPIEWIGSRNLAAIRVQPIAVAATDVP